VPGKVAACRCGVAREDAALPSGAVPAPPAAPATPTTLTGTGFALRIVLAVVVCGGLGAGWYAWNGRMPPRSAERAKTTAAIARRLNAPTVIDERQRDGGDDSPRPDRPAIETPAAAAAGEPQGPAAPAAPPATGTLEDLVARVAPAVVAIETSAGRGSGFFVQPDTIITNAHVAGSDSSVRIHLSSGDTITARVERVATDIDLAVLKLATPLTDQPLVSLGAVSRVRTGEDVVAIGSALGVLQNSVTRGIVSAVRRSGAVTLIQTDAAINPGNSGGPLMDRNGIVIGINTMGVASAQGISFAVAVDHARELLAGRHVSTTSGTPLSTMNDALAARPGESDTGRARTTAAQEYERLLSDLGRRADQLDRYWQRFKLECYEGKIAGNFDREWFSFFEPRMMQGAVSPGCGANFNEARTEANVIRNGVESAEEAARQADVYPGTRRDLRHKYRLDYRGWDR